MSELDLPDIPVVRNELSKKKKLWESGGKEEEEQRKLDDEVKNIVLHTETPDDVNEVDIRELQKGIAHDQSIGDRIVEKESETSDRDTTKYSSTKAIFERIDRTKAKEERRNWVPEFLMHASWLIRIELYGTTAFVWNAIKVMYYILTKTALYIKDEMRYKFLIVPLLLLMLGIVCAPEDETFLQTSVVGSVEVNKNFILNCTCRGICKGNKIWTRGPNNIELAYNQWVLKDKINIIKNSDKEYAIRVLKANKTDIESNYTCHIGFASKQINRSVLIQHSPTQSPTVTSTAQQPISTPQQPTSTPQQPTSTPQQPTSTPQQPKKSNTGEIAGIVIGVVLLVVVAVIVSVLVKWKYNRSARGDGSAVQIKNNTNYAGIDFGNG